MDIAKTNRILGKVISGFHEEEISDFAYEFEKVDDPDFEVYQEATRARSNMIRIHCLGCGHKFNKKITPGLHEVECLECGSYDTDFVY